MITYGVILVSRIHWALLFGVANQLSRCSISYKKNLVSTRVCQLVTQIVRLVIILTFNATVVLFNFQSAFAYVSG